MPKLYEARGTREAAEANAKAARSLQEARRASNVSGQCLANTVLFAIVLFFASGRDRHLCVALLPPACPVALMQQFQSQVMTTTTDMRSATGQDLP